MFPKICFLTHTDADGTVPVVLDYALQLNVGRFYVALNYENLSIGDEFVLHKQYPEIFSTKWDQIIIVDLAMPLEKFIAELKYPETPIIFCDHHPASIPYMDRQADFPTVTMNNAGDKCGTKLYFEVLSRTYRCSAIMKELVEITNTYDLWRKDSELWPMAQDLNRFLSKTIDYRNQSASNIEKSYPFIDFMSKKLRDNRDKHFEFGIFERAKIAEVKATEQEYLAKARAEIRGKIRTDSRGHRWAAFGSRAKISFLANELVTENNLDYIVGVNLFKGATGRISVRSREGFDINGLCDVAGHASAGGGQLDLQRLEEVWKQGVELGYREPA